MSRIVVVTGANRGIGRAVAERLASEGWHVVPTARRAAEAEAVAKALRAAGGTATGHSLDVSDPASVAAFGQWMAATFDRWDALVNNAGILPASDGRVLESDPDDILRAFQTNTLGAWRMARLAVPRMVQAGWGRVVNVSTGMASLEDMGGGYPAYRMSKVALNALTRSLAAELGDGPVQVHSVCPGWVQTDMGGASATRTPAEGAASVVWALDTPDDQPNGGFFRDGEPLAW